MIFVFSFFSVLSRSYWAHSIRLWIFPQCLNPIQHKNNTTHLSIFCRLRRTKKTFFFILFCYPQSSIFTHSADTDSTHTYFFFCNNQVTTIIALHLYDIEFFLFSSIVCSPTLLFTFHFYTEHWWWEKTPAIEQQHHVEVFKTT